MVKSTAYFQTISLKLYNKRKYIKIIETERILRTQRLT